MLILPPIILLLQRHPKITLNTLLATLALVFATFALQGYVNAPGQLRWELNDARIHDFLSFFTGLSYLYTRPLYRACGYLCGCIAGYAMFVVHDQGRAKWAHRLGEFVTIRPAD